MLQRKSIFATLPRTQRGMPLVLGGDPKGKNILYPNGNSIIIRDIDNPSIAETYSEHSQQTTVAKYSPSGFYICSADVSGKVRIWDATQKEHILKNEFQPFVGIIKDLAWSLDSQRIVAVGEGREKFGHVFMMETGTSVGEIAGHSKIINSCDFRPSRPFRIITGSEDNFIGIYEGPPFKFKRQLEDHTRFVQAVRYSGDGNLFVSGGFDGKIFMYNGKDYMKVGELGSPGHNGGVYAVSWSPDGRKLLSCSGDRTCKLWDVESLSCVSEFQMGSDVLDQQVSCLWQKDHLLSVSLSGFINYLDVNNPEKPLRVIKGHNKSITSLAVKDDMIYTGGCDGYLTYWNANTGENDRVLGPTHTNQIQDMAVQKDNIYSCGLDDKLKSFDINTKQFLDIDIKLSSQPKGIAIVPGYQPKFIVAGYSDITILTEDGQILQNLSVSYEPSCVSIKNDGSDVAIGGLKDHIIHIYSLNNYKLTEKNTLQHKEGITDVAYSPDGKYLAGCDANRKVILYDTSNYECPHNYEWGYHTARVNSLAWSPDSIHLASGSLDTAIIIWNVQEPSSQTIYKKAHPQSQITRVSWLDEKNLVSTGQDSNITIWSVSYK